MADREFEKGYQEKIETIDLREFNKLGKIELQQIEFSHSFPIPNEKSMEAFFLSQAKDADLKIEIIKDSRERINVANISRHFNSVDAPEISGLIKKFIEDCLQLISEAYEQNEAVVKEGYEERGVLKETESNLFLNIMDTFYNLDVVRDRIKGDIEDVEPKTELDDCVQKLLRKTKRFDLFELTRECLKNQIFDAMYSMSKYYSLIQMPLNILVKKEDIDVVEKLLDEQNQAIYLTFGAHKYKVLANPSFVILQGAKPDIALPVIMSNTSTRSALELIREALEKYEHELQVLTIIDGTTPIFYKGNEESIIDILKNMNLYCANVRVELRKLKGFLRNLKTSRFARIYKISKKEPYGYYDRLYDDMDKRIREGSGIDRDISDTSVIADDVYNYLVEICDKIQTTLWELAPSKTNTIKGEIVGIGGSQSKQVKDL